MSEIKITALILAAGIGSRMGADDSKQKLILEGESVLRRSIRAFENSRMIDRIILVVRECEITFAKNESSGFNKVYKVVIGGNCRAESAKNGFNNIPYDTDYVAIHDAARCLIRSEDIDKVAMDAITYGAASASTQIFDTVKSIDERGFISSTLNRSALRFVQTPQIFSRELYKKALEANSKLDETITDDNILMEKIGVKVYLSNTDANNIKLTTQNDFEYAKFLLRGRENV